MFITPPAAEWAEMRYLLTTKAQRHKEKARLFLTPDS
jgi:hypothetical protein